MKLKGESCEQVQEYVKSLAWEGRKLDHLDQITIIGEQAKREKVLYNKVNYVITDSPLILGGMYDAYYNNDKHSMEFILNFIKKSNIDHKYYFLSRNKPYVQAGRYETEEQAKQVDALIKTKLTEYSIPFQEVLVPDEERVSFIMKDVYGK